MFGVYDIDLEKVDQKWMPETDLEKSGTSVLGTCVGYVPIDEKPTTNYLVDMVVRTILVADELSAEAIPCEFYRLGYVALVERQFIPAIFNFYFVLEYMFANGKFRKREVIRQLMASSSLSESIDTTRNELRLDAGLRSSISSEQWANLVNCYIDASNQEVIEHIVSLRGLLHHQSAKRSDNWSPNRQKDFYPDAAVLAQITLYCAMRPVTDLAFQPDKESAFRSTIVTTTDGRRVNWVNSET